MAAFSFSWLLIPLLFGALFAGRLTAPKRAITTSASSPWRVEAKPMSQWVQLRDARGYYSNWKDKHLDVNRSVEVRVVGPGATVHLAVVDLNDDDYEAQINAAVAKGEERAMTLNALGMGT